MVDLSKAKCGDTVKFRCGGQAVIKRGSISDNYASLSFSETGNIEIYTLEGIQQRDDAGPSLLDITEVIPAPVAFDWSTVRWGWAFKDDSACKYILIGKMPQHKDIYVFLKYYLCGSIGVTEVDVTTIKLTRSPEHDIMEMG